MNCPICKANEKIQTRIKRSLLIKYLIPFSKNFKCYNCESKYISILKNLKLPYLVRNYVVQKKIETEI